MFQSDFQTAALSGVVRALSWALTSAPRLTSSLIGSSSSRKQASINAVLGAWTGAERHMWFVPWHTGISSVLVSGAERILLGVNDASHLDPREDMLQIVAGDLAGRRAGDGRGGPTSGPHD